MRTTGGTTDPPPTGDKVKLGYFTEWGVYGRNYHVKNLVTSGSASKITHINYAFGNVKNGQCTVDDTYAAYDKAYTADQSVSGTADTWDQPLRGNFNQLRQLKAKYPHIKVLYSFGGWTYSGGFGQAAANPAAFAKSCKAVVEDPRWADVFDGIDIDWEYPNACGLTCDTSGPAAFKNLMSGAAHRVRLELPGHRGHHRRRLLRRQDRRGRLRRRRPAPRLVQRDDVRLLRRLRRGRPDRPALAAHLVPRHPAGGLQLRRRDRQAEGQGRPGRTSCCSASASTAAAGPASPSPPPAARRPARLPAPTSRASRTTRC